MSLKLALAWVILQIAFLAAWAAREEARFDPGAGTSILVRTVPVDPRDLLRGQYLALGYEFGDARFVPPGLESAAGAEVWVRLSPAGEYHVPVESSVERPRHLPAGDVAMLGSVSGGRLRFGIERYFVPEGSETPAVEDTTVRLRIGADGSPRIETVYVRGKPWP